MSKVEDKIKNALPDEFTNIFDGWTDDNTHHVSVLATYSSDQPAGYHSLLLVLTSMGGEASLDANEQYEFLQFVLQVFEKSIENVPTIVGDSFNVNRSFASSVCLFFV